MGMVKERTEYKLVDMLKLFFAVLVVFRHTDLFEPYPVYSIVAPTFLRVSVPFFFVCSGFFFALKYYKNTDNNNYWGGYFNRLIKKLLFLEPINIIIRSTLLVLSGYSLGKTALVVIRSIVFYPFGALWYIQALLIAIFLLLFLMNRKLEKLIIPVGLLLYFIGLLGNNYYHLIYGSPLCKYFDLFIKLTRTTRNGVFVGFPYVGIGILIGKYWDEIIKRISIGKASVLVVLSYGLLYFECMYLQGKQTLDDMSLYISYLFLIPSIMIVAALIGDGAKINTRTFRYLSTSIYLIHSPINDLYKIFAYNLLNFEVNTILQTVCVIGIVAIVIAVVYRRKPSKVYDLIT